MTKDTDRELLELAAKAAGLTTPTETDTDEIGRNYCEGVGLWCKFKWGWGWWNPLTDDGDALRLASKLGISLETDANIEVACDKFGGEYENGVEAWKVFRDATTINVGEVYGNDPDAATRRAIVRASAEIGKEMK